jgi:hypothetical protein
MSDKTFWKIVRASINDAYGADIGHAPPEHHDAIEVEKKMVLRKLKHVIEVWKDEGKTTAVIH